MNVNISPVKYSSIVEIGELTNKLEKETGQKYLKLHRGVMDVKGIDLNSFCKNIDFNEKKIQQYGGNDGDSELISTIKDKFHLNNHYVLTVPGGMASLDLAINSLSDKTFFIPKYHWGSYNKILTLHNKEMETFDDFNIKDVKFDSPGVAMICYPSNPTGYAPKFEDLKIFADYCKDSGHTLILDLPYYYLFNDIDDKIYELYSDNVIILSSFSKSIGLSGLRVGYVATKNKELYDSLRIRSLYKYNSISTIPQQVINKLLTSEEGNNLFSEYRSVTQDHITRNIKYLKDNNLLFDEYTDTPFGPFTIINKTFDELISNRISSVPLSKFTILKPGDEYERLQKISRICVSVQHDVFVEFFDRMLK